MEKVKEVKLKLYLVSQLGEVNSDCYDAFVIACKSEQEARQYNPGGDEWDLDIISVTFLGNAAKAIDEGIILASFNAG
jgi:hypothetical protein